MKIWKEKVKIALEDNEGNYYDRIYEVREHTDEECAEARKNNILLSPISTGIVCLYYEGKYDMWCGVEFARQRIIKE